MSDDDLKITALRYSLLPVIRAFLDREGDGETALTMLAAAIEQAVAVEIARRRQ